MLLPSCSHPLAAFPPSPPNIFGLNKKPWHREVFANLQQHITVQMIRSYFGMIIFCDATSSNCLHIICDPLWKNQSLPPPPPAPNMIFQYGVRGPLDDQCRGGWLMRLGSYMSKACWKSSRLHSPCLLPLLLQSFVSPKNHPPFSNTISHHRLTTS